MKVELRKTIREKAGDIIRPEHVEQPGVLTVTGLLPSPVIEETPAEEKTEVCDCLEVFIAHIPKIDGTLA